MKTLFLSHRALNLFAAILEFLLFCMIATKLLAQQPVQTHIAITPAQAALLKADHQVMMTAAAKRESDKQAIIAGISVMKLPAPLTCPGGVKQTQTIGMDANKDPIELVIVQRCPGIRQASKKAK